MQFRFLAPILAASGMLLTSACGSVPGLGSVADAAPKEDTTKGLVEEARGILDSLKGEYVVSKGLIEEADFRTGLLTKIPEDLSLKKLNLKLFKKALDECFNGAVEDVQGFKGEAVSLLDAAKGFKRKEGVRQLKSTRTHIKNAMDSVKSCVPDSADKARKKLTGKYENFLDAKIKHVDSLRKLVKSALPKQAEAVLKSVASTEAQFAKIAGRFQAELKNPLADQKALKANERNFKKLQTELLGSKKVITTDMQGMQQRVVTIGQNVQSGIGNFGKK